MDIEGERKSQRRRKRDSGRDRNQDGDIGKNKGKRDGYLSLPPLWDEKRKKREKEG